MLTCSWEPNTYNSLPISADTGRDPAPALESTGDPCLPETDWDGLTEGGKDPRRKLVDSPPVQCDWLERLLLEDLGEGVPFNNKIIKYWF